MGPDVRRIAPLLVSWLGEPLNESPSVFSD
jgi:hypothetical protein